jgi:hypothetical protein
MSACEKIAGQKTSFAAWPEIPGKSSGSIRKGAVLIG